MAQQILCPRDFKTIYSQAIQTYKINNPEIPALTWEIIKRIERQLGEKRINNKQKKIDVDLDSEMYLSGIDFIPKEAEKVINILHKSLAGHGIRVILKFNTQDQYNQLLFFFPR